MHRGSTDWHLKRGNGRITDFETHGGVIRLGAGLIIPFRDLTLEFVTNASATWSYGHMTQNDRDGSPLQYTKVIEDSAEFFTGLTLQKLY